jgi:hypothetical protein
LELSLTSVDAKSLETIETALSSIFASSALPQELASIERDKSNIVAASLFFVIFSP